MRKIKLCIVTEFEQENFFQWEVALDSRSELKVSSAVMNENILWAYPLNGSHWDPIREADVVFVYCVRHDLKWEWYELPLLVKKVMNPKAKMICQFDLEFLWLFYPNHHFWKKEVVWVKGKTPEQFLRGTKVMEIADAYIIIFNELLKKYTSKSTYYLPLPQLVRYESFLETTPSKRSLRDKSKRVVVLRHSVKSASIKKTLKKVIIPSGFPVTIFTTENTNSKEKLKILKGLPQPRRSIVYGNIPRDVYMEFLERDYAAIDDNEGYYGWSRFAMECALAHVPCVGSTRAVKEFFPELYTKSKDYKKQKELLKKLRSDKDFWLRVAEKGKKLVLKKMDTGYLIRELVKIIISITKQTVKVKTVKKSKAKSIKSTISESLEYKKYRELVEKHKLRHKTIPSRPSKGGSVMDNIHKRIITQKQWDFLYGKWRKFIEGKIKVVSKLKLLPKPKSQSKPQPKPRKVVKPKEKAKPKPPKPFIRKFKVGDREKVNVRKTLSIIVAARNRSGKGIRAKNFFKSLANQTDKDFELIVIDYGSKPKHRKEIFELCKNYGYVYYYVDANEWYSPRALNIGINKARNNYIMQTNLDMIFRRDFIERIKERLNPNSFIWSVPTFLNKDAYKVLVTMRFTSDWSRLDDKDYWWTTWRGHGYGAIQCMLKSWFVEVGGYDERFHPYGPCDLDLWERAKKDGFEMVGLEERDETKLAMYAHQWHPLSKHFRRVMCTEERWLFKQYLTLCKTEKHQDYLRARRWLYKVLTQFRHKAPLTKFNEMVAKKIVKRSDVFPDFSKEFSVIIPVSRSGKILDRCLKSVKAQNPDEIRAYIDPIKLRGKRRETAVRKLLDINAKMFFQALTSDSDEEKCRKEQEEAKIKLRSMDTRKRKVLRKFEEMGKDWNIHHSAHPDCVRNVHRAILECENKWVIRVDDDDEILMDIRKVIDKFADNSVGIMHGNILFTEGSITSTNRGRKINVPKYVNHIKGSVVILNRDAFKEIHNNITHRPWQDHRRWYWILRAGYENVYVPILFGHVHKHKTPDPIRLAEGGSITWLKIADELNKEPLRLVT